MTLCFELTMPSRNSWDGRWSGEDRLWAIVRSYKDATAEKILVPGSYYYSFGDGWAASIRVRSVDDAEVGRVRKESSGFCGYEWMVDSIERHGKILSSPQVVGTP